MEAEIDRLTNLVDRKIKGSDTALEIIQIEYACLSAALKRLWREQVRAGP